MKTFVILLTSTTMLCACGDDASPDGSTDGGTDGSTDGAADAETDAGTDAGMDVPGPDGSADAGCEPASWCDETDGLAHVEQLGLDEGGVCRSVRETCNAPTETCTDGISTSAVASCDPAEGCSFDSSMEACPARAPRCDGPVHVTYEPACSDATVCDPEGEELRENCLGRESECIGDVFTVYAPRCDPDEGCDLEVVEALDCPDTAAAPECAGAGRWVTTCACATAGCECSRAFEPCPVSTGAVCLDANTLRAPGAATCLDGACGTGAPIDTACPMGCCTMFGMSFCCG